MSNAFSGVGTIFSYCDTVDGVYTPLAEVLSIDGPSNSRDQIEVTNLDSTGGYKEFIGGFRDGGQVSLPMNFTHDTYAAMQAQYEADVNFFYRIDLPNTEATRIQFEGFCQSCPISVQAQSQVTSQVTLKVSGAVTVTEENT